MKLGGRGVEEGAGDGEESRGTDGVVDGFPEPGTTLGVDRLQGGLVLDRLFGGPGLHQALAHLIDNRLGGHADAVDGPLSELKPAVALSGQLPPGFAVMAADIAELGYAPALVVGHLPDERAQHL